ncbi:hypothetical protein BD779DRAFT_137626 [Infundibulicybe gibba]|nr:hypothetical protein BD779DRAFT_137626 [Infundibulicybe gibba]
MSTQHILPLETQMCRITRRLGVVDPLHSYSDYEPDNEGRASSELLSSSTLSSSSPSLICRPPRNGPMTGAPTDHQSTESIACAHGSKIADDRGFIMSLRHPPVNPRKTRRYCTDFGLNDSCIPAPPLPQPLKPDHSLSSSVPSIFSTLLADVEGTESDSSSEDTDYDFPKPPRLVRRYGECKVLPSSRWRRQLLFVNS